MVAQRQAVHVWLHPILAAALVAALGACVTEDSDDVGTTDGAIQPGAGFDAGAIAGGGTTGGGTTGGGTTGGFPGGGTSGGGTTGGGTTDGGTTGGGTTGGFFGGGFPGGRDGGRPDAGPTLDAGTPVVTGDAGPDQFAELRQVCVDTINMYRATLNPPQPPLARANAEQEACSDRGAQYDAESRRAHGSTGVRDLCGAMGLPGTQNTCPGHPAGPGTGTDAIAAALRRCLASMWAEGEPPIGVDACKADRAGCFPMYGHWINMSEPKGRTVSCGFFNMGNNTFWMNQDFVVSFR
jgi:hypothetical protein